MLWILLIALVVAIIIGYKTNINIGIIGCVMAFILGPILLGMKTTNIINAWPTSLMWLYLVVNIFFGFARSNGTMEVVTDNLLHATKGKTWLIQPMVAVGSALIGFLGAPTPFVMGPIAFALGAAAGLNPLMMALTVISANNIGSSNPFTGTSGITVVNYISKAGYENATNMGMQVYLNNSFRMILVCIAVYIIFKGYKRGQDLVLGEAKKFNPAQKRTFTIIVATLAVVIVSQTLKTLFKKVALFGTLAQIFSAPTAIPMGILAMIICNCGEWKNATKYVPLNNMIMISGITMLMAVCTEAGLVDTIGGIMSDAIPAWLMPTAFLTIAAALSFFSNALSVVIPVMFPLVPVISAATGANPSIYFSCIFIGALASAVSPFSTCGSQVISMADPEIQEDLTKKMIPWAIILPVATALLCLVGLWNIIPNIFGIATAF